MPASVRTRLSANMLLSGAVVGAWQPCLVAHLKALGFTEFQLATALSAAPIATMLSPFAGQAADRWVSGERLTAGLAAAGGLFFLAVSRAAVFLPVAGLLLGALVLSGPLFSLATSLSLQNLEHPDRDFPFVRAWGTLGHVAGANVLSLWMAWSGRGFSDALALAGLLCFVLAGASLVLVPHTPPRRDAAGRSAFRKAAAMLLTPSFAVLTACLFALIIFGTFYYARVPLYLQDSGIPPRHLSAVLSIGQATEVLIVFGLGRLYERLGPKRTMLLGLACWVLRFLLLSLGGLPALFGAVALHGACFGCWRIAATMYADRNADRDARSSVQSLMGLTADGSGMLLGNFLVGQVMVWGSGAAGPDWTRIWLVPAAGCAAVFAMFALGFRATNGGGRRAVVGT